MKRAQSLWASCGGMAGPNPLYLLPILDNCVGAFHNVSLARVVPESSLEQNTLNLGLNKVHSDTYRLELKTPVQAPVQSQSPF